MRVPMSKVLSEQLVDWSTLPLLKAKPQNSAGTSSAKLKGNA